PVEGAGDGGELSDDVPAGATGLDGGDDTVELPAGSAQTVENAALDLRVTDGHTRYSFVVGCRWSGGPRHAAGRSAGSGCDASMMRSGCTARSVNRPPDSDAESNPAWTRTRWASADRRPEAHTTRTERPAAARRTSS